MAVGLGMTSSEWNNLRSQVDDSFWVMRIIGVYEYPHILDLCSTIVRISSFTLRPRRLFLWRPQVRGYSDAEERAMTRSLRLVEIMVVSRESSYLCRLQYSGILVSFMQILLPPHFKYFLELVQMSPLMQSMHRWPCPLKKVGSS
jgi:hypothetical protein